MTQTNNPEIMTPTHPRWDEFIQRLQGPEGCNFRKENGGITWNCPGGRQKPQARRILEDMEMDVDLSLAFFEERGGYCDCEVVFNVED